ncbi:hypothetical protein H257_04333 [Aphanomyces astaci]|uniref:Uncharacterized protein n=2 Tax=Aphanomyces astaci TaxID=112090 RepID=W4GWF9_APHAT|nr:hypothetical protein H257_04333 [Aphanomyces astaci]ETV83651.1 hypothetical protein H257_04333 [Aphanomyces astaci]|eukprot:XP_009827081.1 hypothetical protein H257_04333 [Aphanomyces astaci]
MMKGLPSFDFDVRQGWVDLSFADDDEDEDEEKHNWEWFQIPHAGHASPRKAVQKPHQQQPLSKAKPVKGKEEDFIKQMLKEHNAKVKNARTSSAGDARYAGHQTTTGTKTHGARKSSSDERKSSLECAWHSISQESISRKIPKEVYVLDQAENAKAVADPDHASNRRKQIASPGAVIAPSSLSHQSPDPTRAHRVIKSPHEDLQDMLDELKAKHTPQAIRVVTQIDTKAAVKRKQPLPKTDHMELQLLVQQHNDKHKLRRLSSSHHH